MPVSITHIENNFFYHQGYLYDFPTEKVKILCYNEEYPTRFYVDVSNVNVDRPYTIGDLANTFPPGVILAPDADPNGVIFSISIQEGRLDDSQIDEIMSNIKTSTGSETKTTTSDAGTKDTPAATTGAASTTKKGK